jgi:hypothetical protein
MNGHRPRHRSAPQHGTASVEFAVVGIVLFLFIFGVMEISRALFLWSTMTEVASRAVRAAAMTDFNDAAGKDQLRQHAMFLSASGDKLILTSNIGYDYLKIDYLSPDAVNPVASMPANPADNTALCLNKPNDTGCVRYVRVRLCMPNTNCTPVPYVPMLSLPGMAAFNINMPVFTAISPVETLGAYASSP